MDRARAKCGKAGLLFFIRAGIGVDHRGRIGLVDPPIDPPMKLVTQPNPLQLV